jgi:hypothetical protein
MNTLFDFNKSSSELRADFEAFTADYKAELLIIGTKIDEESAFIASRQVDPPKVRLEITVKSEDGKTVRRYPEGGEGVLVDVKDATGVLNSLTRKAAGCDLLVGAQNTTRSAAAKKEKLTTTGKQLVKRYEAAARTFKTVISEVEGVERQARASRMDVKKTPVSSVPADSALERMRDAFTAT